MAASTSELSAVVLNLILKNIPLSELQKLRLVCKEWSEFIDWHFGIAVVITNENWAWTSKSTGTRIVTFHSFTQRFPSDIPFILNLQEINFHRILLTNNVIAILQKCFNIQKLVFSRIILDQSKSIQPPYEICLPNLEILQIHIPNGSSSEISHDFVLIMRFLSEIFYSQLREFYFWCPSHELEKLTMGDICDSLALISPMPRIGDISNWILRLIQKNRGTIEYVSLGPWKLPFELFLIPPVNTSFPYKPNQFEAIKASCEIPKSWDKLIRTQHYLQCLQLKRNAWNLFHAAGQAIVQSSVVILEVILIDECSSLESKEIDLGVFTTCYQLKRLTILFNNCLFINSDLVPTSLKTLELKGRVAKKHFFIFASTLKNLQVLIVDNCEPMNHYRTKEDDVASNATIDVGLFKKLVMLRNLRELTLGNCSLNWGPIMNWCVIESATECEIKIWIERFQGTPFKIHVDVLNKKCRD